MYLLMTIIASPFVSGAELEPPNMTVKLEMCSSEKKTGSVWSILWTPMVTRREQIQAQTIGIQVTAPTILIYSQNFCHTGIK